jgi:acetyltransferase
MQLDETWVMSDGALLVVRPLRRQDASALGASFDGLSPEDRRHRFHGAVNGLPPWYLDSLAGADQWRHVALAASVAGSEGGPLIAEARWVVDASGNAAEFALVVAAAWRRRGVGTRCVRALLRAASLRRLARIYGAVLVHNAPMLALMRRCAFQCKRKGDDPALVAVEAAIENRTAIEDGRS